MCTIFVNVFINQKKDIYRIFAYLACRASAMPPDTRGVAALVPVKSLAQHP